MKFCFWGNIAGALRGRNPGGAELQIALLAKALALKGHEVVVVDPYSKESFITEEGVRLIHLPKWNKGIRGFRLFIYRIPGLRKIFRREKADYYYVRMRSYMNLLPYLAARKNKSKFIMGVASDLDVLSFGKKFKYNYKKNFNLIDLLITHIPNDFIHRYLLKRSDFVMLQHSGQAIKSKHNKSRQFIYPNIMEPHKGSLGTETSGDYYMYVGALSMLKGADNLLKLIDTVKESVSFLIVGFPRSGKPEKFYEKLRGRKNVILAGRKPHSETLELISKAKAIINTSYYEGFSNVFLEAWSVGIPVISLNVNPGEIFEKFGLGICCYGDLNRMKQAIESDELATIDKNNLKSYISTFHNFDTAADRFITILNNAS